MSKAHKKTGFKGRHLAGIATSAFMGLGCLYWYGQYQNDIQDFIDQTDLQYRALAQQMALQSSYNTWVDDSYDEQTPWGQTVASYTFSKQFMLNVTGCTKDGAHVETNMQVKTTADFIHPVHYEVESFPFAKKVRVPDPYVEQVLKRTYRLRVPGYHEQAMTRVADHFQNVTSDYFYNGEGSVAVIEATLNQAAESFKSDLIGYSVSIQESDDPKDIDCMVTYRYRPIGGPDRPILAR